MGPPGHGAVSLHKEHPGGRPIDLFNEGDHTRDFTYVDDIVDGILLASDSIASPDPSWDSDRPDPGTSNAPYRVLNIGNNDPVKLSEYVAEIEKCLGMTAQRRLLPLQPGDVPDTFADVSRLMAAVNYKPSTPIAVGVRNFVDWYRSYHG